MPVPIAVAELRCCPASAPSQIPSFLVGIHPKQVSSGGDVLLYLDADSLLPDAFPKLIRYALAHDDVIGGAFEFEFGGRPQRDRWVNQCLR
jgi:hypothetical protein